MDRSGIMWIGVAVVVLVFLDLLFVELRRGVREAKRIVLRLQGYTELPLFSLMENAGNDVERIASASDEIASLIERGTLAVTTIRSYLPKGVSPG
jgi:hypothetical protein